MSKPEILVVAKLPPFLMDPLNAAFVVHDRLHETDPAAFAKLAPRIRGIAASGESKVTKALIDPLPALEIVSVMGVGYDGIDVAAAKARNVVVTHTPNVLNDDVADLAIALMLSVARAIPRADRFVREGRWLEGPMPLQRKMSGARLGLLGMGRIGQAIAHRAVGFGMPVLYHNRSPLPEATERACNARFVDKQQLLRESDFLMLVLPLTPQTRHAIGAPELALMKPTAVLVNVARGGIVDDKALTAALRERRLAAAGLDVFEGEPALYPGLLELDNVVLSPHIASASTETRRAMTALAVDNVLALFGHGPHAGRPPTILNPNVLA